MDLAHRDRFRVRTVPGRSIAASLITLAGLGLSPARAEASSLGGAAAHTVLAQPTGTSAAGDEDADGTVSQGQPGSVWRWEVSASQTSDVAHRNSPSRAPGVVLAFRHEPTPSRLTLDTRSPGGGDAPAGQPRRLTFDLGLESSRLQGLARGNLLRAQLNAHSHLTLRVRGGRLGLHLGVRITSAE